MSVRLYYLIFLLVVFAKIALYVLLGYYGHDFFGGGNDADYYNAYALGETDTALITNYWPVILRELNELGVYSRNSMSFVFFVINIVVLPFLAAKITLVDRSPFRARSFWFVVVVVSIYPTLFFFSLDIYREILMVFIFLLNLLVVNKLTYTNKLYHKLILFTTAVAASVILYFFRPYLGFALLVALSFFKLFHFSSRAFVLYGSIYILFLNVLFALGFFDTIMQYRSMFDEKGGSNFGIYFESSQLFLPDFLKNFSYQMLGIYYSGLPSIFVFLIESLPVIFGLFFLLKNRRYANSFIDFLFLFFIIYSSIWLLGNDNLGTAVRLRIFSYLSILISCVIVYQRKFIPSWL